MDTLDTPGRIPPVSGLGQNLVSKKISDKEGAGPKNPLPRRLKTASPQNRETEEETREDQHHIDIRV